jgi:hypothetical protein
MVAISNVELNRVAVSFPAWTDGIIGEIMWTEPERGFMVEHRHVLDALGRSWRFGPQATHSLSSRSRALTMTKQSARRRCRRRRRSSKARSAARALG